MNKYCNDYPQLVYDLICQLVDNGQSITFDRTVATSEDYPIAYQVFLNDDLVGEGDTLEDAIKDARVNLAISG